MHVRTFEGLTMKDALRQVRQEFGADAVILKTKEKDMPGTKAKTYEITATAAGARGAGAQAGFERDFQEGMLEWTNGFRKLEGRIQGVAEKLVDRDHMERLESGIHELKMLMLNSLREKDGTAYSGLAPEVGEVVQRLQLMGVAETRVAELAKFLQSHVVKLHEGHEGQGSSEDINKALVSAAVRWMMKRIKIAPKWQAVSGQTAVAAFVGTAGSGKSSIVAKLASQWHVKDKKDIAIISCDNVRIGGAEQMRIFAKVLGVPFELAGEVSEVPALLEKHGRRDLVLIDTAGRSPKLAKSINDWLDIKDRLPFPIDFHLVASTTEKEAQIDQAIKHFARLGIQSLIFTKLDESWSYGEIFNMAQKWSIPLSYFGIGTRIPEDFERATRERVVERIFGL